MHVILRFDGIDRHYPCASYFDADVLFDILVNGAREARIELWDGMALIRHYDPA